MKQPLRCLVVCQAGEGVGLGHLMRSLVAARSLQKIIQADIHFLVQCDALDPYILGEFVVDIISKNEDLALALQSTANTFNPDVVVMDLFGPWVPQNFSNALQVLQKRVKLVAIDALAGCSSFIDLLFIPSFLQPKDAEQLPANTVFGWDCFLLNVHGSQKAPVAEPRVLVLTGGSDATGLGQTWPALLNNALSGEALVDWVTGPYAKTPLWPTNPKIQIQNHLAPKGLGGLMHQASFALTVYGVSFYELLYLGIPAVVFSPYGAKDHRELDAVHQKGIALVANDEAHAVQLLTKLMSNPALAKTLSLQARETLSKPGGQRLALEITKLLS
jgi:spore coat polysaccharide biosynthesis predicted glycosyltransferase SpsG